MKIKCVLLILGVILSATVQAQWQYSTPNSGPVYYTGGNVGIGTVTPAEQLHLNGGRVRVENAAESSIQFKTNTSVPTQFWDVGANAFGFYVYETESHTYKFNVSKGGNVGISTNAPQARLHVNGGSIRVENSTEASIQFKTNTSVPVQHWDVGGNVYGFYVYDVASATYKLVVNKSGNVGVGTLTPDAKLAVNGDIHAKEVRVDVTGALAPDYVFEKDYELPSLTEVHAYIKLHKHLPEVPSAMEMEEQGLELKAMNLLLLKKVEELTLHAISQEQKIDALEKAMKTLEAKK